MELDAHDVLITEGLSVESYLDTGDRAAFDNGPAPISLHPEFGAGRWEMEGCARLVTMGPELETVRRHLRDRAMLVLPISFVAA